MKASKAILLLVFGIAAAAAAGCGSQTATLPSSQAAFPRPDGGIKQRDLLYVSNANGTVSVYRYWQHTLVTVLTKFAKPMGECADAAGDVYVADFGAKKIYEYAHGGTKAIHTIDGSPNTPRGCSVARSDGDLAVANYGQRDSSYYGDGNVAVYAKGHGSPSFYGANHDNHFMGCAYDDRGDLLAVSETGYSGIWYYSPEFFYLPKHGTSLITVQLPNPYSSSGWYNEAVQGVAWDGKYWIVVSYDELYLYTINVKAEFVSRIKLSGSYGDLGPVAVYRKALKGVGTQVVAASSKFSGKGVVDYWHYPAGGSPLAQITSDLDAPYGVAISMGTP
ncbi:MAG TPA: hypothetical protein VHR97_00790 [Candidatus Baltobacteraceae bacterium]|jgi:hypothetical protein|nr:hypothetical protein [Candidatus Baltobacteraceae bacterium]